jgi:hypothetical protein
MLCGKCKRLPVLYVVVKESWSCLAVVHLHALVQQHAGKGLSLAAVKCDEAVGLLLLAQRGNTLVFSALCSCGLGAPAVTKPVWLWEEEWSVACSLRVAPHLTWL